MGIQLECQYEEDLTKQPEARVRWYEAAGGTTLWEMTTDPVRSPRVDVLRCLQRDSCPSDEAGGGFFVDFGPIWSASGPSRRVRETAFLKMA